MARLLLASQVAHDKEFTCNTRDVSSIPGLGRSPGDRNGNPLQFSCLGNLMDRGASICGGRGML